LIPTAILASPFLFIAMMMGSRLLSTLTGPVNIWNMPTSIPPADDIAGHYRMSGQTDEQLRGRGIFISNRSGFTLYPDHKLEVVDLPAFDEWGKSRDCNYNGIGTWNLYGPSGEITLDMNVKALPAAPGNQPSCGIENASLMTLLGHSAPHRFWYFIGDPDEDTGLLYRRE
jgi:hypothetical protein